jgi:hypothetical protein
MSERVGSAATGADQQPTGREQKTRQGRALRRHTRAKSSYFALMCLFSAALFLIGVVIVLVISLAVR